MLQQSNEVEHKRDEIFIEKFGQRVRELRKAKGWAQEQLANVSDIELSQINRIELGKINTSLSQISVISKALDIHPKDLFDFQ